MMLQLLPALPALPVPVPVPVPQGGHGLEWSADWSAESSLWRKWPEAADICLGEGKPGIPFP